MKKHQEIPSFHAFLLLQSADDRQKKMQYKKTEDRKAIRKSARRTFLSLATSIEQHPCMWEGQGADAVSTG